MTTFTIFQPILTDRRIDEVNAAGDWSKVEWGSAYMAVTNLWDADGVSTKVRRALDANLFCHSWTVEADDVADTFPTTNGMSGGGRLIWVGAIRKSGSVGDVAIGSDGSAWVCLAMGWAELADDVAARFTDALVA